MSFALRLLASLIGFFFKPLFRTPDPIEKAHQEAFNAKAEEARVMEAGDRPESRVNDILLQHDERHD